MVVFLNATFSLNISIRKIHVEGIRWGSNGGFYKYRSWQVQERKEKEETSNVTHGGIQLAEKSH